MTRTSSKKPGGQVRALTLADTSLWVDHFRRGKAELRARLEEGEVAIHPLIIGELACGSLPDRERMLNLLRGPPPGSAEFRTAWSTRRWKQAVGGLPE